MCESCETRPASTWCNGCIIEDYQAACGCAKCVVRDTNPELEKAADLLRQTLPRSAEAPITVTNENYYPTVAHLTRRNREMHDRAQKAEAELARLRRERATPDGQWTRISHENLRQLRLDVDEARRERDDAIAKKRAGSSRASK
jgi:hypothetical protein